MTDIAELVTRLRKHQGGATGEYGLMDEAADEIERWHDLYKDSQARLDMVDEVANKARAENQQLSYDLAIVKKEYDETVTLLVRCEREMEKIRDLMDKEK